MRTTLRTLALAAVAGLALLADRPAAQNTYADFPFKQGSLFYRPSGRKPPKTSSSSILRPAVSSVARPAPLDYATPPRTYAPAPVYAPQAVTPTARYYYYPAR